MSRGVLAALASAALFGASTPLAKLLLSGGVEPWMLAGLLYLGSGFGLGTVVLIRRARGVLAAEAPLRRADRPWLAVVTLSGGVLGPLFLMLGLATTPASSSALLLNVEGLATMAIAWVVFRENVDCRLLAGAGAIFGGALLLSLQGPVQGAGWGAVAIIAACLAWGLDNNLTRKLSAADPVQIAAIKGLVAGAVNLLLALIQGAAVPPFGLVLGAALIGLVGYGVSLVLFVLALRHLGTARAGAYFSTAPFIGASLALVLLPEQLTRQLAGAAVLIAIGLYLHLTERHEHEHTHEELEHDHRHVHDLHHQHMHAAGTTADQPHAHSHRHRRLTHRHPHYPDLHHRHDHAH